MHWWIILYALSAVLVFWVFNTAASDFAAEEINTEEELDVEEKLNEEKVKWLKVESKQKHLSLSLTHSDVVFYHMLMYVS